MKKGIAFLFLLALGLVLTTTNPGFAKGRFGAGNCDCYIERYGERFKDQDFKNFKAETLPLRQELSAKRFELEKEYLAEKPNEDKIARLKEEIRSLLSKLQDIRSKYRFPWKRDCSRCY